MLQAGQSIPDWITKLPKPSKMKRKTMGKMKRPESVNEVRKIDRQSAIKSGMINYDMLFSLLTKSRDMIAGSKHQKVKAAAGDKK